MEAMIERLRALIARGFGGTTSHERRPVKVDTASAPPSIQQLVEAMASTPYKVDFGEFLLRDAASVTTMAAALESACEGAELDAPPVDAERTLLLAADRGGMSALGLGWDDGGVFGLIVELDDPTPENAARRYDTPEALLAALDDINRRRGKLPDVEALRGT